MFAINNNPDADKTKWITCNRISIPHFAESSPALDKCCSVRKRGWKIWIRFFSFENADGRFGSVAIPVPNGLVGSNIMGIGAAGAFGWPGDDRMRRLRWASESPRSAAYAEEFRA
jgi:hypothetical protein